MNRRIYDRLNIEKYKIPIDVIDAYNDPNLGNIKDISKGGICFYTNEKSVINKNNNIVDVIILKNGDFIAMEVEILREEKRKNGKTEHAGRFLGVPSVVTSKFPYELVESNKIQLVLV